MIDRRRSGAAGVSRAALLVAGAFIAAVLVLGAGAIRSGPGVLASASPVPSGAGVSPGAASLPPPATDAPTAPATPAPPEPTPAPSLRGAFVGGLAFSSGCMLLAARGEAYVLVLPAGYTIRQRDGRAVIVDRVRATVAGEGDLVGMNGEVKRGTGPYCMVGPQLHVTRIVEVVSRGGE